MPLWNRDPTPYNLVSISITLSWCYMPFVTLHTNSSVIQAYLFERLLQHHRHWLYNETGASIPPEAMVRSPQDGRIGPPQFLNIMHFKCCADRWHDLHVLWQSFWN